MATGKITQVIGTVVDAEFPPGEMPATIPSARASLRAICRASSVLTWTTPSRMSRFRFSGTKPAPIP